MGTRASGNDRLGNLDEETRFPTTTRLLRHVGLQSVCGIPLSDAHHRLGSLVFACARRDAYSAEDVRFCTLVANQVAIAMDDALNFRASQRARERLELLLDLTNRVVSKLNLRDVLREISANIRRVVECDSVAITLPGPEDQKLRVYALDFPENPSDIEEGFELTADENAGVATVFQTGEAVILSRDKHDSAGLSPPHPDLPQSRQRSELHALRQPDLGLRQSQRLAVPPFSRTNKWDRALRRIQIL